MKRLIIKAIFTMCAKALGFTAAIAVIIAIIGYVNKWDSTLAYSNAFFLAGCLMIVAGTASNFRGSQENYNYRLFTAESFRGMSGSERALYIMNVNSPISNVILGVLTGILLILISAIAAYLL